MILAWFASLLEVLPRQHNNSQMSFFSSPINKSRKLSLIFLANFSEFLHRFRWAAWKYNLDAFHARRILDRVNIGGIDYVMLSLVKKFDPMNLASREQFLWSPLQCCISASTISTHSLGVLNSLSAKSFIVIWTSMLRLSLFLLPRPLILPLTPIFLTRF